MRRPSMALLRIALFLSVVAGLGLFTSPAFAHALRLSYVDLHLSPTGIEATVEAPAVDLAQALSATTPEILLTERGADAQKGKLAAFLLSRLILEANQETLRGELRRIEPVRDQKTVRLRLHYAWSQPPAVLRVHCRLFPQDPQQKTFLDIYQGGRLERQLIFNETAERIDYPLGSGAQRTTEVIKQFVCEGIHHIFLGPDHILFVIGLLLLGGTRRQLLKIVSAFTLAHSITLTLATLNILNPPSRIIEPTIAASIVFVGVHSLLAGKEKRDLRLLFAFCFGFIHGFGFAGALREMELPRYALAWSLFSFNVGVEIGQACIVLCVAPLLALLSRRSERFAHAVMVVGSWCVVLAGAYWFGQRLMP